MLHLRIFGPSASLIEVAEGLEQREDARHVVVAEAYDPRTPC